MTPIRNTHAAPLARAAMTIAGALAALAAAVAAALIVLPAGRAQADTDGSTWAADQSLEHLSSSLSGWYAKATNVDNNSNARHGPGRYTPVDAGDQRADPCPEVIDGGQDAGKCSLDDQWNAILANPATAGGFTGFYRQDYSNVPLGGTINKDSNATQGYSYKSMVTSSRKGDGAFLSTERQGPATWAYYGAALQALGLDSTGLPGSAGMAHTIAGGLLGVLYLGSLLVGLAMQLALLLLKYINPGTYLLPGFQAARDNGGFDGIGGADPQWVTGAGTHLSALDPLMGKIAGFSAVFSAFGLFVTIPVVIFLTLFVVALWRSKDPQRNEDRANGAAAMGVKRVLAICLSLGLLMPLYTGVINSISSSPLPATGSTELVQSLLVDTGNWARYNALSVPADLDIDAITYSRSDGQPEPASVVKELQTARSINASISIPNDPSSSTYDPSRWHKPYPRQCGAGSASSGGLAPGALGSGGAAVSLDDGGLLMDGPYDGSDLTNKGDPGCDPGASASDTLHSYLETGSLIARYINWQSTDVISPSQYAAYVNSVIQDSSASGDRKGDNYTPASQFIAPDWAGDTGTPMDKGSSMGMCSAAGGSSPGSSGGKPSGAAPQACKGRLKAVAPASNGLIAVGRPSSPRAPSASGDPGGLKMGHPDGDPMAYRFWSNVDSDTCDLSPLKNDPSKASTLTSCNMSPLAEYNYLSTVFGDSSMAVYSAGNAVSGTQVPVHYATSMVGTAGFDRIANGLYVGSLLGMLAVVGLGYALALAVEGCRNAGRTVMALPGTMLGVAGQAGKLIIAIATMAVVVFGTYGMWMVASAVQSYLPRLVPDLYNAFASVAATSGHGSVFADNAATFATSARFLIALVIIALMLWLLRIRDMLVQGVAGGIGDVVGRWFRMDRDKSAAASSTTGSSQMIEHSAGVLGAASGALAAYRMTGGAGPLGAAAGGTRSSSASGDLERSGVPAPAAAPGTHASSMLSTSAGSGVPDSAPVPTSAAPGAATAALSVAQAAPGQAASAAAEGVPAEAAPAVAAASAQPGYATSGAAVRSAGSAGSAGLGTGGAAGAPGQAQAASAQGAAGAPGQARAASAQGAAEAVSARDGAAGAAGADGADAQAWTRSAVSSVSTPGAAGSAGVGTAPAAQGAVQGSTQGSARAAASGTAQGRVAQPGTTGSAGMAAAGAPASASASVPASAGAPAAQPKAVAASAGLPATGSAGVGAQTSAAAGIQPGAQPGQPMQPGQQAQPWAPASAGQDAATGQQAGDAAQAGQDASPGNALPATGSAGLGGMEDAATSAAPGQEAMPGQQSVAQSAAQSTAASGSAAGQATADQAAIPVIGRPQPGLATAAQPMPAVQTVQPVQAARPAQAVRPAADAAPVPLTPVRQPSIGAAGQAAASAGAALQAPPSIDAMGAQPAMAAPAAPGTGAPEAARPIPARDEAPVPSIVDWPSIGAGGDADA